MNTTERINLKEKMWLSGEFHGHEIDDIIRMMENGKTFDNSVQTLIINMGN